MANQIKENEAANISPYYEQAAPASLVSVQGFLSFVRHRWYWYVISVAVCVGIAWLMLARSPRLYTKSETILIKDPTFGNSASSVTCRKWVRCPNTPIWRMRLPFSPLPT